MIRDDYYDNLSPEAKQNISNVLEFSPVVDIQEKFEHLVHYVRMYFYCKKKKEMTLAEMYRYQIYGFAAGCNCIAAYREEETNGYCAVTLYTKQNLHVRLTVDAEGRLLNE